MTIEELEVKHLLAKLSRPKSRIVGIREVTKALKSGRVSLVFIAADIDKKLTVELERLCKEQGIPIIDKVDRYELGSQCKIEVPAAAAAITSK